MDTEKNKKQIKVIIIVTIILWLLVIIGVCIFSFIKKDNKITSDEVGNINISKEASTEILIQNDATFDEIGELHDSGNVVIYDNEDQLSASGFISLKGHIYLPEKLTQFLAENNYSSVETITVIPESVYQIKNMSYFTATIDGTDEYIKISHDTISSDFTFIIEDNYSGNSSNTSSDTIN